MRTKLAEKKAKINECAIEKNQKTKKQYLFYVLHKLHKLFHKCVNIIAYFNI